MSTPAARTAQHPDPRRPLVALPDPVRPAVAGRSPRSADWRSSNAQEV
ncbi:hypothetical protein QJS66_13425 [Kocuria rhizophila]|nr:hypothetical protein QJS66_13425 [Kocuria rhizophila]